MPSLILTIEERCPLVGRQSQGRGKHSLFASGFGLHCRACYFSTTSCAKRGEKGSRGTKCPHVRSRRPLVRQAAFWYRVTLHASGWGTFNLNRDLSLYFRHREEMFESYRTSNFLRRAERYDGPKPCGVLQNLVRKHGWEGDGRSHGYRPAAPGDAIDAEVTRASKSHLTPIGDDQTAKVGLKGVLTLRSYADLQGHRYDRVG